VRRGFSIKIISLTGKGNIYTSNVYLIVGSHNAIEDVNTLIDVGRDPSIIEKIQNARTGVGKKRVEQVVLTHSHYDHVSLLPQIRELFEPIVYSFSPFLKGVDRLLKDGDELKFGDRMFEVIYAPGHSQDSLCFYCAEDRVLFVGDNPIVNIPPGERYEDKYISALAKLARRDTQVIYFGHGNPLRKKCNVRIRTSLANIANK